MNTPPNETKDSNTDISEDELVKSPEVTRSYCNLASKNSMYTLNPRRMLNDDIVTAYMNIIFQEMDPYQRETVHLFSNFFFSKVKRISKLDQDEVRNLIMRWDKDVKLFNKDFLALPICEGLHWLLLIICFPQKVPSDDDVIVIDPSSPDKPKTCCILIFDSLRYNYLSSFTDPLRHFLKARWKYERPTEKITKNFMNRNIFPDVIVKVPKQPNSYDCGVYMLHFFEKFFSEATTNFVLTRQGKDLTIDWFINSDIKRKLIQGAITRRKPSRK